MKESTFLITVTALNVTNRTDAELQLEQEWTIYPPSVNPCCERGLGNNLQQTEEWRMK